MRLTLPTALLALPLLALPAFAAGSGGSEAPKPTETSTECKDGEIFDKDKGTCEESASLNFDDDDRYDAIRELAYAGRYISAQQVPATVDTPDAPRFLTYEGFVLRKMGQQQAARDAYENALSIDPTFVLARSYMAQGMLTEGDYSGAMTQLNLIEKQAGRDTWAYVSLARAIQGEPTNY